jgi:hypothetical protein
VAKKKQKASGLNAPKPLLRGKPLRTPVRIIFSLHLSRYEKNQEWNTPLVAVTPNSFVGTAKTKHQQQKLICFVFQ